MVFLFGLIFSYTNMKVSELSFLTYKMNKRMKLIGDYYICFIKKKKRKIKKGNISLTSLEKM